MHAQQWGFGGIACLNVLAHLHMKLPIAAVDILTFDFHHVGGWAMRATIADSAGHECSA